MGFDPFKKIKKTVGGIASDPTNFQNYADLGLQSLTLGQVDTDGVNGLGSFSDVLLGKKSKDIKPDDIANQIRATQSRGLADLNNTLNTPADKIVREQVAREKQGVLSAAQDARRNAQRTMAQRGLAGTSLGLNINRSIDQDATKAVGAIDAKTPGAIRNQSLQDAVMRIQAGGINQNGINFHTIEGQRSGGLLGIAGALAPIAGTVAGAMMGGPAGAGMGAKAGLHGGQAVDPLTGIQNRGY